MYQVHTRLARFSSIIAVQAITVLIFVMSFGLLAHYIASSVPKTYETNTPAVQSTFTPLPADEPTTSETPVISTPSPEPVVPQPTASPAPATSPAPAVDQLSIPSLGFSSRFVSVGLTKEGNIDVDAKLVGWWNGSAAPGSSGAAFLDGHIAGVFRQLPQIKVGDTIEVSRASGQQYSYTVVYRETVPLQDVNMKKALTVYGGASEGLNLMTCAGSYDATLGTNNERLIVYAVRS